MSDHRETVSWEELCWSNHLEQEALVRILVEKGILTKEELLAEVGQIQQSYMARKL